MSPEGKREPLANLGAGGDGKRPEPESTLADLVESIHSEPPMRDWVTLESLPLSPLAVPLPHGGGRPQAVIYLLLACRAQNDLLRPPWGLLVWHWPSRRLRALLDVRCLLQASSVPLTVGHLATREHLESVQQAIERGMPAPVPPDPLPALYARIQEALEPHDPMVDRSEERESHERSLPPPPRDADPQMADTARARLDVLPVPELMTRARSLIEEAGQEAILGEWRRLYSRMHHTGFAVAVAGEFNRGKSTLVNHLLDQNLLPTDDLPTTAMVARVLHGPRSALWHITPGPRRERKELAPESWTGLTAQDSGIDPEGVMEVQLPHNWLNQTGIQFVDTPGAGDLTGKRAVLATDAISHCAATLVTVSATMPLSLTERSFVDEHVLSREMPRVAVVLTRLDQVPKSDRLELVRFVAGKLQEWAPEAELWCAHGHDILPQDAPISVAGPESIRKRLISWASDPDHVRLRSLQAIAQLRELVQTLCGVLAAELAAATASEAEREKAIQQESEAVARSRLGWEDLRLAMEARCRAVGEWLEGAFSDAKPQVIAALTYEMRHAPNPKDWWEKDLPYRLRRELLTMSRPLNQSVRQRISEDAEWLHDQVKQRFSWTLELPSTVELVALQEEGLEQGEAHLSGITDLSAIRLWTRLGLGALTLTGLMFPVIRLVALGGAMVGGVASESLFKGKIDEQKRRVAMAVGQLVEDAMAKGAASIINRLQKYYGTILSEAMRQEALWFQARQNALSQAKERTSSEDAAESAEALQRRLERARSLATELSEWLRKGGR